VYEDEAFKKSFDPKLARRILRYTFPYWKVVVLALVALLLTTLTANVLPLILKYAIDHALVPTQTATLAERYHVLLVASGLFVGVRLLDFAARYTQVYALAWLGQHVLFDLRSDIFRKVQRLHLGYFDRTPVGRLLTRITSDVDAINQFITGGLVGTPTGSCASSWPGSTPRSRRTSPGSKPPSSLPRKSGRSAALMWSTASCATPGCW